MIITAVTVFMGGSLLLTTTWVLIRYFRQWRRTPGRAGLLPLHIWLIALSYDLLVVIVVGRGIAGGLDDSWAWLRIPALAIGLGAMFILANFQRGHYNYLKRDRNGNQDADR